MAKIKKKYPDSVVYNEEKDIFDANIKPYPTSVSSPSFKPIKVDKGDSIRANKYFESRIAEIKEEYKKLVDSMAFDYKEIFNAGFGTDVGR